MPDGREELGSVLFNVLRRVWMLAERENMRDSRLERVHDRRKLSRGNLGLARRDNVAHNSEAVEAEPRGPHGAVQALQCVRIFDSRCAIQ